MRSWLPTTLLAVCALALRPAPLPAADIVLVVGNSGSLTSQETHRKGLLESWGHTVALLTASSSQASYDAAVAAADAAYVTEEIASGDVGYKLREAPIGVVCEEFALDLEFGFASTDGYAQTVDFVDVADNSHAITSSFATGSVQVVTWGTELICLQGSFAPGGQVLANIYSTPCLMAVESGGTLANSYNSSSTAFGRRVRLPFGGNYFDGALLNANGELLIEQAVEWAASGGDSLLLHWKFDETSGAVASDSSGEGNDGTISGTTSWGPAVRSNGLTMAQGSNAMVGSLLGNPSNVTLAAWVNLSSADIFGSEVVTLGDHIFIRTDVPDAGLVFSFFHNNGGDGRDSLDSGVYLEDTGWRHVAAVLDDDSNEMRLYVDGELVATQATTNSIQYSLGHSSTHVGRHANVGDYFDFAGAVDDVRVYNYAMTPSEIVQLYGLVGHWRLDETSGTTAADSSPSGADGTLASGSPAWAAGVRTGAIDVESSTGDRIDIPAIDVTGDQITLSAWVKPETLLHEGRVIMKSSGNTAGTQTWGMTIDDSGDADFRVKIDGAWTRLIVPAVIEAGRWQLLTGVYDGAEMRLYIDGQLGGTMSISGGGDVTVVPTDGLTIGDSPIGGRPVDGLIDDVRVYSYALNDWEIGELYGLIGHWKFDETSGTVAADSSHYGNDANLSTGSAAWSYGARNYGAVLDGSTAFRPADEFNPPPVGAIALWIRQADTPAGNERILGINGYWELVTNSTGEVRCELDAQGGGWQFNSDPEFLTPGLWRHVIACYDSESDLYELYLDGQLFSSGSFACNDEEPGTLTLGGRTGSSLYFDGDLDDIRIYNRWPTPREIAEIYGLVAHWKLDETSGATAYDSSGMEHHATLTGSEGWVEGLDGGGFYFDYANGEDYFEAPRNNLLDHVNEAEYTMMAFYKPDSLPTGSGSAYDGAHTLLGKRGYHMRLGYNETGRLWGEHWTADNNWRGAFSPLNYSPGKYYHVTATVSATLGRLRLYVDGEYVTDYTWTAGLAGKDYGGQHWQIGIAAANTGGGNSWGHPALGVIDDVRIYNRVLSGAEIQSVYSSLEGAGLKIVRWVEAR